MQALIPTGDPGALVAMADVPEPTPSTSQLIVEVEAFSPNRGETFLLETPRPNWRPGKDIAGRVVQEAASGLGPALGSRVVAHSEEAGWAQRAAVPVSGATTLPDTLAFEVAAALPLAGLTALRLLRCAGPLSSRRILLTGASGGVGHYFVELAARQGARVTAVTSSAARGERLRELGAEAIVTTVADAHGTFDVVLDSVGGDSLMAVLRKLVPLGQAIWFGQASRVPPTLDFFDWDVPLGISLYRFGYQRAGASDADDLATLVHLVERGDLHPEIGAINDWTQTAEVINNLVHRQIRGNAVLTISRE